MLYPKTVRLIGAGDEHGNDGFICAKTRTDQDIVISASTGATLAHDILEHIDGPQHIGDTADELQALGAFWFIRGECERIENKYRNIYQILASDIVNIFRDWYNGNRGTISGGNPREHAQDWHFNQTAEYALESFSSEVEDATVEDMQGFLSRALPLFRAGYSKAESLYKDQYQAWELFEAVTAAAKRFDGQTIEGLQYRCRFGFDRYGTAFCHIDEIYQ